MGQDRRRHTRFPRLLEVTFEWMGERERGITTDISLSGAFVNALVSVPLGEAITLSYHPDGGEAPLSLIGQVTRVTEITDVSTAPGLGIAWDRIWTAGSVAYLGAALKELFQTSVTITETSGGGSLWCPKEPVSRDLPLKRAELEQVGRAIPRIPALAAGTRLACFIQRQRAGATVTASGRSTFEIQTDRPARVGDVVVFFHRLIRANQPVFVRIVGMIARRSCAVRTYGVQILRVDLPSAPGSTDREGIEVLDVDCAPAN